MKISNSSDTALATLSLAAVLFLAAGCADPFTKTMKRYGYAPAIPAPATLTIGDIYDTADLKDPYALMTDNFTKEENAALMTSLKDAVSVPDSSGEKSFKIDANADVVGKAKLELEAHGVSKFKVTFGGATQYIVSKTKFENDIYPKIKQKLPGKTFDKKFVSVALFQISTLEYEFYTDKGAKINVEPGSDIEKVLKAKLGAEFASNERQNLSIKEPRFIGYRLGRLTESGFRLFGTGTQPVGAVEVHEISAQDLRDAAR